MTNTRPLKMLHMDFFGPVAYISIGGNKYGLVIVDDYSRFTWVFFLQEKSETQEVLKKFLRRAQNEFGAKVKKIRSDNNTEFKNTQVEDFLDEECTSMSFRPLILRNKMGWLDEYKTSNWFWAEEINTTCHATNRLYLHMLLKKTSYELLTGNKPNVSYFQVFGSKCYILQKMSKSSKFAPKTYEGVLLGYDSNSHAYRIFNVTTGCVETTCDVVFDETNGSQKEQVDLDLVDYEEAPCDALQRMVIGDVRPQDPSNQSQETSQNDTTSPAQGLDQDNHEEFVELNDQGQEGSNNQGGDEDDGDKGEAPPHPRVCQNIQKDHPVDNILGDIEKVVTTRSRVANFYDHYSFVSSFEPFKVEDALHDPDWVVAMQEELNNFKRNEV
jgi:hypothetical protein